MQQQRRPELGSAAGEERREVELASVLVLIGTMLVDMIGFGIVLPLLPYYAVEFGADDWMVGPLVASFSVAQLLATPFLGKISDHYGRRPLILAGLALSALSYVLFGLATTVTVLFVSRIVQGASGGTIAVAQAYVADTTAPERRAQVLGWLSAATGAAFMVGPAIGSWAWRWGGHTAPGFVAAALCLVNLALAVRFLPEPVGARSVERRASLAVPRLRDVLRAALSGPLGRMIAIYFLGIGAFASMTAIFPLYLGARFAIDESTVGYVFVYVGSVSVLVRGVAVGKLVRRFGEPRVSRFGAVMLGLGLGVGAIADTYLLLALALTLVAAGTGTLFPPLAALISRSSAPEVQGSTLGINQFFGGVARVVGPLWGAAVFDAYGPGAPFLTAALVVAIAFLVALGLRPATQSQRAAAAGTAAVGVTSAGERRGPG
ncbi:MAG: MFS transporter [Gemmatimonadota bacterium]|nr:MAG: MFS transporter [Gemmatimonadota bacterium]